MAKSGYISVPATYTTSGAVADTLKFSWQENSQSVADNTTTVGWTLQLIAGQYGRINSTASKKWSVSVNENDYSGTNLIGIENNATKTLASGTTVIPHNADGTKTFSFSFSQQLKITFSDVYIGTKTGAGTGTLDTIARASQPSCVTWPEHTQNVGEFGDTINIFMNRAEGSGFTHTVRYQFGSQSGTIATGVTNDCNWTIPLSLMNLIPNDPKGSGTIYVDTYNGSTLIDTKSCGFTATVPNDIRPTVSVTLEDITGIDDIYGKPVQGLSKIKLTISATPAYNSPIDRYFVRINRKIYNVAPAEITTDFLTGESPSPVNVEAIDKRGHFGSWSYQMTVLPYSKPSVNKITAVRCNADGTVNKRGAYIKATFTAQVTDINSSGLNTPSYTLKYKKTSQVDSEYTEVPLTLPTDSRYNPTNYTTEPFAANIGNSYDVVISVADSHTGDDPATNSTKASTATSIFSWRGFKRSDVVEDGAGIGKIPEKPNVLQVGWEAEFDKTVQFGGNRYTMSSTGTTATAGYVRMASITITAANADTPITFVFTQRRAVAPMTVYVGLRNADMESSTLQSIVYEGENYGAFLVKADTLTWDLYVQKSSTWDTITLQEWYTSKTMDSRMSITFPGDLVSTLPGTYYRATPAKLRSLLDHIFPINSIYISYSHTSPASLFGGTWERIENRFLWATDASGGIGNKGGESTHTLTEDEMPDHSHSGIYYSGNRKAVVLNGGSTNYKLTWTGNAGGATEGELFTGYTGNSVAHNNMPPYIQVSVWKRVEDENN